MSWASRAARTLVCSADVCSRKGLVAGSSVVDRCVRTKNEERMQAACVDQQTVRDDGETAHSRRSWTETQDTKQSQRQLRAISKLSNLLHCNWLGTPGIEWRGSREAGVLTGMCAPSSLR